VYFRLLCELSNDIFSVLNGWVIWEEFWFEARLVMIRVSCHGITVYDEFRGMF